MANEKKLDVKSIVIIALLVLTMVLCIVGVCITWMKATIEGVGSEGTKLSELADMHKEMPNDKFKLMYAFAIIAVVLCALNTVVCAASKLVSVPVLKKVGVALSALVIVGAILSIVFSYVYMGQYPEADGLKYSLVGGLMLGICGIVNGIAGAYGSAK